MKHQLPKPKSPKKKSETTRFDQPDLIANETGNVPTSDAKAPETSPSHFKSNLPVKKQRLHPSPRRPPDTLRS